jgi:hypothetical protein
METSRMKVAVTSIELLSLLVYSINRKLVGKDYVGRGRCHGVLERRIKGKETRLTGVWSTCPK